MKTVLFVSIAWALALGVSRAPAESSPGEKPAEPTQHQKVYYFEHQLLPKWVHKSDGAFFEDLASGATGRLSAAATKIVGKPFADALHVRVIEKDRVVLLTFAKPGQPPECFYAALIKNGTTYRYLTLEADEDITGQGVKAFYCEWTSEGSHSDFGPRRYDDEASFLEELGKEKEKPATPPQASFTPSSHAATPGSEPGRK